MGDEPRTNCDSSIYGGNHVWRSILKEVGLKLPFAEITKGDFKDSTFESTKRRKIKLAHDLNNRQLSILHESYCVVLNGSVTPLSVTHPFIDVILLNPHLQLCRSRSVLVLF